MSKGNTNTISILTGALELLEKPNAWIQGDFYRNAEGDNHCEPSEAICFCSFGAIGAAAVRLNLSECVARMAVSFLSEAICFDLIAEWNDKHERTAEEVRAAFRKAIELASAA